MWSDFDPYFLYYTQIDLNQATENFRVHTKGKMLPIALPCAPFASFSGIHRLLTSSTVTAIVFVILHNAMNKSPRVSGTLLDSALHLLYLAINTPTSNTNECEETKMEEGVAIDNSEDGKKRKRDEISIKESISTEDGQLRSVDEVVGYPVSCVGDDAVIERLKFNVNLAAASSATSSSSSPMSGTESLLSLLIQLKQRSEFAEQHSLVEKILVWATSRDAECAAMVDANLGQKAKGDEDGTGRGASGMSARERARQRALEQMKKQQQAFMAKMGSTTQGSGDGEGEGEGGEAMEGESEEERREYFEYAAGECVLCHEKKTWEESAVGLVGLCQRSRLVSLANFQEVRRDKWARQLASEPSDTSKRETQTGSEEKTKGKEPATEPVQQQSSSSSGSTSSVGDLIKITARERQELRDLLKAFYVKPPLRFQELQLEAVMQNPQLLDLVLNAITSANEEGEEGDAAGELEGIDATEFIGTASSTAASTTTTEQVGTDAQHTSTCISLLLTTNKLS